MKQDARGVVYVEALIAFLPVLTFFFGTLHVADVSVAHLLVDHAATVAARAAVVVLPDDGAYYEDRENVLLHRFESVRRDNVEAAADYVLGANPRLDRAGDNVALDKVEYSYRDPLTARVSARYTCLITMFCAGGIDINGKADLVYQGANYIYESHGAGIDNLLASATRPDRGDRPNGPSYPDPAPSTGPAGPDDGEGDGRPTPPQDDDRRPPGGDGEGGTSSRGPPADDGHPTGAGPDDDAPSDRTDDDTLPDDAIAAVGPGDQHPQGPDLTTVPSVRNGEFARWFNALTVDEFDQVWADPNLRRAMQARLRSPGGLHEWHLVSRADVFKRWGVTAEQIADLRTATTEVRFVNPPGRHGGPGSTTAHNELLEIIDSSTNHAQFTRRLQNWANYRLEGGVDALPAGLRPQ